MCEIVPITIPELWSHPQFADLVDEYAAESAIDGLPPPNAKRGTYENLENAGLISTFAAIEGASLLGFIVVILPVVPHYSQTIATTESFFVGAQHRKSGAGLKLLRTVEQYAKEHNAVGLLVSAPTGGRLAEVMPRLDYVESNRVFFRKLNDEPITQH